TLDVLSEGRFELGLGAGFSQSEYEQGGLTFDAASTRLERLGESIQILKGLFSGEAFTFVGKHYAVTGLKNFPAPVQHPHPPLLVAGASHRLLSIAAEHADIVGLQTVSTGAGAVAQDPKLRMGESVKQKIKQLRQLAGERFGQIELSTIVSAIVVDDRREA